MINLRDYQQRALDNVDKAEREGVRRPLIVHPTGTGKGVVMGAMAARRADRGRTLVMVHRKELAEQFIEKLGWQAPELETGIVKAERDEVDAPVVVASVPTLARQPRLDRLTESGRRSPFGTIIVDEAHLSAAPTWVAALQALGSWNPYGPLTVGLTATPERDKKQLGVWEKVIDYMSIREAIYKDYLCPILPAVVVETKMDLGRVKRTGGDYSEGDLGGEMEGSGAIDQIADAWMEHARDRKTLAFTPTVKTAHLLAEAMRKRGIAAEALDGSMDDDVREAILARLKSGETVFVANCAVLTTGFDEPTISCIVPARPTTSHTLYVQMCGRGTRKAPGKKNLLIMDVVGASQRHDLVSRVDLGDEVDEKKKKPEEPGEQRVCRVCEEACDYPDHKCALCHRYLPYSVIEEGGTRHENCQAGKGRTVDVFGESRFRWLPVGPGWCLGAGKEVVIMAPVRDDVWQLASYENGRIQILHSEIPSDWAMGIGEDRAKAFQKLAERDARWLKQRPTDAQLSRLVREGLPESKLHLVLTRGDASDLATRIVGRRALQKMTRVG